VVGYSGRVVAPWPNPLDDAGGRWGGDRQRYKSVGWFRGEWGRILPLQAKEGIFGTRRSGKRGEGLKASRSRDRR